MQTDYKSTSSKSKKTFWEGLSNLIKKVFYIARRLMVLISEILQEALQSLVFLVSLFIKFVASPSTPCILAIIIFAVVVMVTSAQWFSVGMWFGRLFGLTTIGGYSMGAIGMFFGISINAFQLSSELWKISRKFAEYYAANRINPNFEPGSADANVKARIYNWLNHDHKNLKVSRRISYLLETGIMVAYTLIGDLNLMGLILGSISLFAPEAALKFVCSTISLLGKVDQEEGTSTSHKNPEF